MNKMHYVKIDKYDDVIYQSFRTEEDAINFVEEKQRQAEQLDLLINKRYTYTYMGKLFEKVNL
jgi:hypothetical protein